MNIKDQRESTIPAASPRDVSPGEMCICEGVYCMRVVLEHTQDVSFIDIRTGHLKRLAADAHVIKVASQLHVTWEEK